MTRQPNTGLARAAFGALLMLGTAWAARAESVPASFDCAKAATVVEKFICSRAVLRWNDLALSRAYAAAKAGATGAARDDLMLGQRDWVRERDRRCIADRTFKELSGPPTELQNQAYECLKTVYLDRRGELQDRAAAPLLPHGIEEIDLEPIAAARPEIVEGTVPRIAGIKVSPDGSMLAILLPGLELDGPDQIWLYGVASRKLVAATPAPDRHQPHPDGSPAAIQSLGWQGGTLYARIALWSKEGKGEEGATAVYAAAMEGNRRLGEVPAAISALLDDARQSPEFGQDEMMQSDGESPEAIRGNRDFLAWIGDRGHGTIELKARRRAAGSPAYLVAWGGWELADYLFDADRSRLVYAADTGIAALDMTTRGEQRIAGTSQGDRPYAVSGDFSVFVWSTRNACGDEFLTEQDEGEPERFCLAHLPKPGKSK